HPVHGGSTRPACPGRQGEARIAPTPRILDRLERWCRRTEDQRYVELAGAPDREIPRGITETLLLLQGCIVLFVNYDEPRPGQWREDRRTRPDDNVGVSADRRRPAAQPLGIREAGVQLDDGYGKSAPESPEELRCQADLR